MAHGGVQEHWEHGHRYVQRHTVENRSIQGHGVYRTIGVNMACRGVWDHTWAYRHTEALGHTGCSDAHREKAACWNV